MKTRKLLRKVVSLIVLLLVLTTSNALAQEGSFDLAGVPEELHSAIIDAITRERKQLVEGEVFAVTAFRMYEDSWAKLVVVHLPHSESNFEDASEMFDILMKKVDKAWIANTEGTVGYVQLMSEVPEDFIEYSKLLTRSRSLQSTVTHKLPFPSGNQWRKTQGWHPSYGMNGIDFMPNPNSGPNDILATAEGLVRARCNTSSDPAQVVLEILHPDSSVSQYLHLDKNTARIDLDGKYVLQGQYLGTTYDPGYTYSTPCGNGASRHLHFGVNPQDAPVTYEVNNTIYNGTFNDVAALPNQTVVLSNNTQTNGNPNEVGGRVMGNTGYPVSGADVWYHNTDYDWFSDIIQTNSQGYYLFSEAIPGSIVMYAELDGIWSAYYGEIEQNASTVIPDIILEIACTNSTNSCGSPPPTPTNLLVISTTNSSTSLSWSDVAGEDGYKVYRWNGSNYTQVGTTGANQTGYTNSGLSCGTTYYYKVSAYNASGESSKSGTATATTSACSSSNIPTAPSNLTASGTTQTSTNLYWNDNSSNESGFKLYYSTDGSSYTAFGTVGANTTSTPVISLSCGRNYWFKVSAHNQYGESSKSNSVQVTTSSCPVEPTKLYQLNNFEGSIVWQGGLGFSNGPSADSQALLFPSSSFSAWVYSEDNKSGDKRCFWDSVANLGDHSWNLKIQSIEVFDHDACPHTPNPPTHMYSVNTTQTGTTLHWIDNSDNETRFIIYKDDVRAYYPPQNAEQYQISDLACGTSYSFEVSADWEGVGGESQKAGPLTVTTGPCPEPLPPMPTNLQTTGATESSVSLSWNSVLEADSYLVERNSGSSWYLAGIVYGSGNNSYTVTGLECATAHSFRVHSRNGAGDSAASSEVSAATASCPPPLAQPNDFAVSGSTQTSISFTWTDTNDNEDGYRLYQQDGMFLFPILETDPNVTSVTAEGLDCSETRSYSLAAFKGSDESSWSSLVSGSTDPCLTEPAAPSNLYADNLDMEMGTVDLHWQDNSDNEDGFILLFSFGTEGPFYEFWTTGPNVTMVTAEQLDCSMTYRYSIMAFNDAGRSNNISPITLTTDTCPEDLPTPTPTPQPTPTPTTPPPELQNKIYLPAVFK